MLLEVGPQPVLTAAALRAWPDPATAPRAIPSLRRNIADHRQITEALANAYIVGHLPDFDALQQGPARKLDLPTYPFQHRQYWFRDKRVRPTQTFDETQATRTDTVRLLEDGRIEELAALLGGAGGNQQAVDALEQLAAQHNQQRKRSPSPTPATRFAGRNPLRFRRPRTRRPARDMPGFSSAMTPRPFSHWSTCSPRVATSISFSVCRRPTRTRKNSKSRCALR